MAFKKLTKEELERRIMNAAAVKGSAGVRSVGSLGKVEGGISVRSRTFRDAGLDLLRGIGNDIVDAAKNIYRQEKGINTNPRYLPHSQDPRTISQDKYIDSFDVDAFAGTNRPSVVVRNNASVTKQSANGVKNYRYGDVAEWGRSSLVKPPGQKFKIPVEYEYAENLLNSFNEHGRTGTSRSIYNPETGDFLAYDKDLETYYQYTSEVPPIKRSGIIARAVDLVLGQRAARKVEQRRR